MAQFCTKCGSPLNPDTGLCPVCAKQNTPEQKPAGNAQPPQNEKFSIEKAKAEKAVKAAEEKAKKKEEKKRAWEAAKKRYNEDVAAKKTVLKKAKKDKKQAKLAAMTAGQKAGRVALKITLVVLIVAILAVGGYFGVQEMLLSSGKSSSKHKDKNTNPTVSQPPTDVNTGSIGEFNPPTGNMPNAYKPAEKDAEEFFHANSEIVSQIPAASAGRTETQANVNLRDRGFMNMPITVDYKMDGTYTVKQEISTTGTEKHPIYTTTFVTTNGNIWVIMEINGDVFALPLSFNQERGNAVPIILSETETITSYDSASNQFFVTKPDESVYTVKVVERIDAETLDALTRWEVEQL